MKVNYIAPLTEIIYLNADVILTMESNGIQPGPDVDANTATFNEVEELTSTKNLWDD